MEQNFIKFSEFSKFRESDKSLKHELGCLSHVLCWHCGSILVCYIEVASSSPFDDKYFYRLQRSWGKVMFLQASVILLTGGECLLPGWAWSGGCLLWGGGVCSRGVWSWGCLVWGV